MWRGGGKVGCGLVGQWQKYSSNGEVSAENDTDRFILSYKCLLASASIQFGDKRCGV